MTAPTFTDFACCDAPGVNCVHKQAQAAVANNPALACPADCPDCATHPLHQLEAYRLGHDYGHRMSPADLAAEIAYFDGRITHAEPLTVAWLTGILDGLRDRAKVG